MKIESFSEALTNIYVGNPCGVQPTALWKTLEQVNNLYSDYKVEENKVQSLKLWSDNISYIFWDRHKNRIDISKDNLNKFNTILVHETQMNDNLKEQFPNIKSYFKLLYRNQDIVNIEIPDSYYIRNVDINLEIQLVSDLISSCYEDIKPNAEEVIKWTKHSVFQEDLWIWIIDKKTEMPVALGIAELDMNIREGALEWIQVLPDYHGKKLGKVLVVELLKRLKPNADFTTVSGELDNKTNPERLYRSCGFTGDDIWHVLRR